MMSSQKAVVGSRSFFLSGIEVEEDLAISVQYVIYASAYILVQTTKSMEGLRRTNTSRASLFSLTETPAVRILRRNEGLTGKIYGVIYWYHFWSWYPYVATFSAIVMYLIPLLAFNTIPSFLLFGSGLSIIMCSMVMLSYVQILPWRKHPSVLIFCRTLCHLLFSITLFINSFEKNFAESTSCHVLSFFTQFTFLTGESWLVVIAIDLILSLSNPFTSYTGNLNKYHLVVWTAGLINASYLTASPDCQGVIADICWIEYTHSVSSCLWGFYLSWYAFI
jgi:hypothetical protein